MSCASRVRLCSPPHSRRSGSTGFRDAALFRTFVTKRAFSNCLLRSFGVKRALRQTMTRLLSPPTAVELTLAADGSRAFVSGALNGPIDPIARWKVETEWRKRVVVGEYWT